MLPSEVLTFDFVPRGLDEPFSDQDLAVFSALHVIRDRVTRARNAEPGPAGFRQAQRPRNALRGAGFRRYRGQRAAPSAGKAHRAALA